MQYIPIKTSIILIFIVILMGAGCANRTKYTGQEFYYKENGVYWSCREPRAYRGGNCKPESDWAT